MTFLRKIHKFGSPFKLSLLFCALSPVAQAQSQYFNGRDIDYWNKGNKSQKEEDPDTNSFLFVKSASPETTPTLSHSSPPSPRIRENDARPFSWEDYNDPKKATFWDDGGDYIPPRPYRELVINPTPENAKKYLEWQVSKMKSVETVNRLLGNSSGSSPSAQSNRAPSAKPSKNAFEWKKVDVLFFYLSTCPHCKRNLPEVSELKRKGARLIAVQIDSEKTIVVPGAVGFDDALKAQFKISATPTWIMMANGHLERSEQYLSLDALTGLAKRLF